MLNQAVCCDIRHIIHYIKTAFLKNCCKYSAKTVKNKANICFSQTLHPLYIGKKTACLCLPEHVVVCYDDAALAVESA